MRDALRDAFSAGYRASGAPCITEAAVNDAFSDWYQNALDYLDRTAAPLRPSDKKQQELSCGCGGTDDYCSCQNVRLK